MHNLIEILEELKTDCFRLGQGAEIYFNSIRPYNDSGCDDLIFFNKCNDETLNLLQNTSSKVVLIDSKWGDAHKSELQNLKLSIFLVDNPRYVIALILRKIYPVEDSFNDGIHNTALVDAGAVIGANVSIGPYCIIGKCKIGVDCHIGAYTCIKDNVEIGNNVIIREHCVIGGQGFGMTADSNGEYIHMPHIGKVIIEDNVEIFPYTNVDRATLGETRISRGAKIDHYVHIGHNCSVGENSLITAGVVFCGKSSVGKNTWIGVGSILKEGVHVGDHSMTGLGSVVIKNVEKGQVVAGVPAKILNKTNNSE